MAPRLPHAAACREPLSSLRARRVMGSPPWHRAAHHGAPRARGLSPALSLPPGKRGGKHWLLLLNKLYRGLSRFNQSLVIRGVLSCCSDPILLLDLRAGAQEHNPPSLAPASLSGFPFPSRSRQCHFSLQRSIMAKAGICQPSPTPRCSRTLSPSSLPSLPLSPAQGKIDQCIFIDVLNTQKKGGAGGKEMLP